jgi:site-specific recombinase XerD
MKLPPFPTVLDELVQEYHSHLIQVRGLAGQTCAQRVRYVKRFLQACGLGSGSRLNFRKLTATWLLKYVLRSSAGCQPRTLRCQVGAVRSFLRFLTASGRVSPCLAQALPSIRAPYHTVGYYLSSAQLRALLRAFDRRQAAGVRDYAMALLAAQVGLRAKEIAQLRLEDIDWKHGTLALHHTKVRRSRLLPLPAPIGQAIAQYLCSVRPASSARQVFLCLHRPSSLTPGAVSDAIAAAFKRASLDVPRPGTHLLRHTLATHLVQRGASLKAIADVLGHRSLNTTLIYAQVNLPMLAQVAQPWPKEQLP